MDDGREPTWITGVHEGADVFQLADIMAVIAIVCLSNHMIWHKFSVPCNQEAKSTCSPVSVVQSILREGEPTPYMHHTS